MSDTTAALEAEIERTRAELADTVDQLAAKLDVKSRARTGAGVVAGLVVVVVLWKWWRR